MKKFLFTLAFACATINILAANAQKPKSCSALQACASDCVQRYLRCADTTYGKCPCFIRCEELHDITIEECAKAQE